MRHIDFSPGSTPSHEENLGLVKVLLFSNLFPSATDPTRGIFSMHRFRALARHVEARVVSPLPWWSRVKTPLQWLTVPKDDSFGLPASYPTYWSVPGKPQLHGRLMAASLSHYLRTLRREFPYDVILAAWAYPDGVAAARLAEKMDLPLVTMVLGSDVNEFAERPELREQIRWGLDRAERVVAVSHALKERVVSLGNPDGKVVVQHNGVDGERFFLRDKRDACERLGLPTDRPLIAYVGNFKPEKGVEVLLEAMGRLKETNHSATLVMVGSGPLEETLKARAKALGLVERVRFCGRQPHDEIPFYLSACDVFCLPSFREGCPNVVLEALASGRPVVASAVGGVPELLNDLNGRLVPPGDPDALAAALKDALSRAWDPESLRATVPFLTWDQFGLTLKATLEAAIADYHSRRATASTRDTNETRRTP